ncbi:MAG: DUF4440 domain-containing protein [bacterium]|nr:DUF4440 domain-containing protein [bacterium]
MQGLIPDLVQGELARPWALAMTGALVKSGGLLLLVGALAYLMRRAAAATRHLVWTLGIGGILLLPLLTGVLPVWRLEAPTEIPLPVGALRFVPPAELAAASGGNSMLTPVAATEATGPGETGTRDDAAQATATGEAAAERSTREVPHPTSSRFPFVALLFWVWIAGMVVVLGRLAAGSLRLRRVVGDARVPTAAEGGDLVSEIKSELGIVRPVEVVVADVAVSPQIWGLARSTILLPGAWRDWDDKKRRQVLVHELAHIRRGDCLTQAVAHLACAIYWCNPLVWLAAYRMQVERERACDDLVLSSGEAASSYADNLLEIASTIGRHGRPAFGEVPMARSSQMSGRLLAVLDTTRRRRAPGRTAVIAAGLLLFLVAAPLAAVQTAEGTSSRRDDAGGDTDRPREIDLADFEKAWTRLGERMIEAAKDRDASALASCYTSDAKLYSPGRRTLHGRDEVEDNAATFWSTPVADFEITGTEFHKVGDMVCCLGRVRALDRHGDVMGTNRFMSLYRWENGRWRIHRDIVNN